MYTIHDEHGREVSTPTEYRGTADAIAKAYYARNQCYVEIRNWEGERLYYWGNKRVQPIPDRDTNDE